jgi:bloom syndrome protein
VGWGFTVGSLGWSHPYLICPTTCSQWGHDFRPDYLELRTIRKDFPSVPIMALTATANERLVKEAISLLNMRNCYVSTQSFNRPNLRYDVRRKDKNTMKDIAEYIKARKRQSGIVYCLSRKDTEKIAEALQRETGVKVAFYHADMPAADRERVHQEWSSGRIPVICATVAFGMGINKPDVRYVIHYSLPKSLTHYYQESGRAGRDSAPADCILYYSFKDKAILEHMIRKGSNDGPRAYSADNYEKVRYQIDNLFRCVSFCANEVDCRRALILEYFGERFDVEECKGTCDNCRNQEVVEKKDVTQLAKQILRMVQHGLQGLQVTLCQLMGLVRGENNVWTRRVGGESMELFGVGKKLSKSEVERVVQQMVLNGYLAEEMIELPNGFPADYVGLGEQAHVLLDPAAPDDGIMIVSYRTKRRQKRGADSDRDPGEEEDDIVAAVEEDEAALTQTQPAKGKGKRRKTSGGAAGAGADKGKAKKKDIGKLYRISKKEARILEERLDEWRKGKHTNYWNIMENEHLHVLAAVAPRTIEELRVLPGFGSTWSCQDWSDVLWLPPVDRLRY